LRGGSIGLINKFAHGKRIGGPDMTRRAPSSTTRGRARQRRGRDGLSPGAADQRRRRPRPHEARYAALLSPQGKVLFDFLVVRAPLAADEFCSIVRPRSRPISPSGSRSISCAPKSSSSTKRRHGIIAYWQASRKTRRAGLLRRSARQRPRPSRHPARAKAVAVGERASANTSAAHQSGVPRRRRLRLWRRLSHDADWISSMGDFEKGCFVARRSSRA